MDDKLPGWWKAWFAFCFVLSMSFAVLAFAALAMGVNWLWKHS